ncbi:universal stress protein [Mycolicibacterium fluoranthenivorans]|jgi:nucleotide-binding universal stress UspA family protein|uniref:Nucleotide-binding universal stress protein, UspA family n=1 Tax=Mycolicibacterium fluoranthenivorans TaxID=258505 RepID=A0A1G4WQX5_9MYCO|nr:universal stress protein [Mycolicibacterium fluoranthenivorans]SCX27678.1 Nucleotide-binding universal stress protein, UspA family [Mycolicibacterium fluoranthenivorans]
MTLVVGYLATAGGADALSLGVRLARTLGTDLQVCLVLAPDDVTTPRLTSDRYHEVLAEQGQAWLAEALRLVPDDVTADGKVIVAESVAEALGAEALRLDAEAIVVGGSGGGLAGSLSLGALVDELLHTAPVPVAVAPRGTRHSEVERVRSVTCAIGDRAGARRLLDAAVRTSSATGAPLRLVSLVALDQHGATGIEAAREHAYRTLKSAQAALPEGFAVTAVVADGATIEAAVDELDWADGDLLMLGSSRLAPPRRLLIGSTAAKILRVLRVPIIVTPGED